VRLRADSKSFLCVVVYLLRNCKQVHILCLLEVMPDADYCDAEQEGPPHSRWFLTTSRHFPLPLAVGRGYQQDRHLLPVLPMPHNQQQGSFNAAHGQVRAVLSRTLGHLKRRFRVLQLLGSPDERLDGKQRVIEACCVLHNLANQFSVPAAPGPTARDLQHPAKTAELPMEMLPVMPRFQLHHDLLQLVAAFHHPAGGGHVATATESDEDDPPQTLASKWPPSK